jgi:hypothetical protein
MNDATRATFTNWQSIRKMPPSPSSPVAEQQRYLLQRCPATQRRKSKAMSVFSCMGDLVSAIHDKTALDGQRFSFGVTGGGARLVGMYLHLSIHQSLQAPPLCLSLWLSQGPPPPSWSSPARALSRHFSVPPLPSHFLQIRSRIHSRLHLPPC